MTIAYGNLPPLRYYDPRRAYPGYTLFSPMGGNTVWLIDMEGRIVHHWNVDYPPGCHGRLLPNGNLLYAGKKEDSHIPDFGGSASIMLEFDWDGNVVWTY